MRRIDEKELFSDDPNHNHFAVKSVHNFSVVIEDCWSGQEIVISVNVLRDIIEWYDDLS